MANLFNKETGQILYSVNTPSYSPDIWAANPTGLEAASAIPEYYRVFDNGAVREATDEEKAAIDLDRTDQIAMCEACDAVKAIEDEFRLVYTGQSTKETVIQMVTDLLESWE